MKRKLAVIILGAIILLSALVCYQRPIRLWAYDWTHILLGGLYDDTTGIPLKVDSEGNLYVSMENMTLLYTGVGRGGVSTIVSTVTPLAAANLAFGLIFIEDGSPGLHRLANGSAGQEITIEFIGANPAYTIGDNPMTRTGWDTITFNNAYERVTIVWLDDTYGWVITSWEGVVITH